MPSLPQDGGHHSSDSLRDGKGIPAAANITAQEETTPLLFGHGHHQTSSGYTDLSIRSNYNPRPTPSDSNGFCRVRHEHGHGNLDEADSSWEPEQSHARQLDPDPRQQQSLNVTPSSRPQLQRLWNTISKRLVFLQRDDGNERSPLEKDLVRRLDVFLLTFGCISQGRF